MMAWFAGCVARPIPSEDGILSWDRIRSEIRPLGPHWAPTGAVTIENTHNMAGGTVYPPERIREIAEGSHALGLKVHMDGARVFNAAAATGVAVREIVAPADTVMFCLSKGLGAPVGSILAGTERDMERARLYRKRLGGGMRQAGVLAAAGLIALEETPPRLVEDHANARFLADGLASLGRVRVSNTTTNIVIFDVSAAGMDSSAVSAALKTRGVLINGINPTQLRAVTHLDVSRADCERALTAVADVLKGAVAAA
jgi:threonine aldolase